MAIESVNPATGEKIKAYPEMSASEVEAILQKADQAFSAWRRSSFSDRARVLQKVAAGLRRDKHGYAALMAQEMGKPLAQGQAEADKCAWVCDYYAENAEKFLSPELVPTDASKSFVTFEPMGIVLAIMPWNFPFWQVIRFAAPALMAGNAVLLKHASNVPGCALAIEELFRQSELPQGLFRTLLVESDRVASLINHPAVRAVTLTGSTLAGKAVATQTGAALKKLVLELGGSDPYVVLEDADLEPTVEACVASRLINSGQSCIAAKRFIVPKSIRKSFEERFVETMKAYRVGDPFDEGVTVGPLARRDLCDSLHAQVVKSLQKGARALLGGKLPVGKGAYYFPTVLTDVEKGAPAYDEETFGPVAAIITVADDEEAVRVANDSVFGLGAAIFTRDVKRGERIATEELQAGSCFVNTFVKSDPRLPFGGTKLSGYGRELSSFGIREFVNVKTVYVK